MQGQATCFTKDVFDLNRVRGCLKTQLDLLHVKFNQSKVNLENARPELSYAKLHVDKFGYMSKIVEKIIDKQLI